METTNTKCDGTCGMVCDCYDASIAGSAMAIALDIAMACDTAAQDRYLAIYGVPYVAICTFPTSAGITATTIARTVR